MSQINSVSGTPAGGETESSSWTMSYAPVPPLITRTVVNVPTYNVQIFDSLLGVTHTSSTGVQINLPIANTFTNKLLYIFDEAGNAQINNISIVPAENEHILDAQIYNINTAYGSVIMYSNGDSPGRWFAH